MSAPRGLPLLFLDVDGPLIPFGGGPYQSFREVGDDENPLLERVDPAVGQALLQLPAQVVWATSWSDPQNVIAPLLGLPELEAVVWPDDEDEGVGGLHWKTKVLVAYAAGRPFVWVDDEITEPDERWVAEHASSPALLHRVDPRRGLQGDDFSTLRSWLATQQ